MSKLATSPCPNAVWRGRGCIGGGAEASSPSDRRRDVVLAKRLSPSARFPAGQNRKTSKTGRHGGYGRSLPRARPRRQADEPCRTKAQARIDRRLGLACAVGGSREGGKDKSRRWLQASARGDGSNSSGADRRSNASAASRVDRDTRRVALATIRVPNDSRRRTYQPPQRYSRQLRFHPPPQNWWPDLAAHTARSRGDQSCGDLDTMPWRRGRHGRLRAKSHTDRRDRLT